MSSPTDFSANLTVEKILERHGHRVHNPHEADRQIVAILQEQDIVPQTHDWSRFREKDETHIPEPSDSYIQMGSICGSSKKNFTLNFAFGYIGGFGRFQTVALILFAVIRNFGMFQIYGFAMATSPQPYLCKQEGEEIWQKCDFEYICENREINKNFEFRPDDEDEHYIRNWFVTLDLMCMPQEQYNQIGSFNFLGYGFGFILCFIPQIYGRKWTMSPVLVANIFAIFLIIFSPSIGVKKLAMFMYGFFHIKVSLCYTHMFELIEDKHRVFCSTIITGLDVLSIGVIGFYYKYVSSDMDHFFTLTFIVGVICSIIFMFIIPESPQWLFMNKGSNSQEAISILNYIAKFNGSRHRIPSDANFDRLGQYIEEQNANVTISNHVNQSSYLSRSHCNKSILNVSNNAMKDMTKTLKKLYLNPKYSQTHILLCIANICYMNIYYIVLYNSKNLKGDEFKITILLGLSEFLGVLVGEKVMDKVPETVGYKYSTIIAMVCFLSIKVLDLTQAVTYAIFLVQIFFLGIALNSVFCLHQSRTKQSVQIVSFEIFLSKAQFLTLLSPIIAQLQEPIPTLTILGFSIISIFAIDILGEEKAEKSIYHPSNAESLQNSIIQMVLEDTTLLSQRSMACTAEEVANRWNGNSDDMAHSSFSSESPPPSV